MTIFWPLCKYFVGPFPSCRVYLKCTTFRKLDPFPFPSSGERGEGEKYPTEFGLWIVHVTGPGQQDPPPSVHLMSEKDPVSANVCTFKSYIFLDITPYSPFKVNRRSGGTSPPSSFIFIFPVAPSGASFHASF